jgi:hypothetical protein
MSDLNLDKTSVFSEILLSNNLTLAAIDVRVDFVACVNSSTFSVRGSEISSTKFSSFSTTASKF